MTADERQVQELQTKLEAVQRQLAEAEQERHLARQERSLFEDMIAHLPFAVVLWRLDQPDDPTSLRLVTASTASLTQAHIDLNTQRGQRMGDIFPQVSPEQMGLYARVVRSGEPLNLGEVSYRTAEGNESYQEIQLIPLAGNYLCIVHANVNERKRAEELARKTMAMEEALLAQQATMAELLTPLIPISDEVVVMPLVGALDSRRAQQVMETLLEGIAERGADIAIIDITGVPVVDTQVANALLQAAQAVQLLGAQVILSGIRSEVAQTLVGLGADLSSIVTVANLQSGIAYATKRS